MTYSNDIYKSIQAERQKTSLTFDLTHLGTLFITGKDAEAFLQGQLTCDVSALKSNKAQATACCNLQGRIVALFFVMTWQEGYLLLLPKEILENTYKHFKKYALFSKVTFKKDEALPITGFLNHTPEGSYSCFSNLMIKLNTAPTADALSQEAWHYQQMCQGFPNIYPSTQETFLPHRIGLEKIESAISFKKGCYLGQEIIARTHFKAIQKHAVYLCETSSTVKPGEQILSQQEENIGEIIDVVTLSESVTHFLAAIKIDSIQHISATMKILEIL